MTRSSRIIIIFVVIALMLGIGCLFLIDFQVMLGTCRTLKRIL